MKRILIISTSMELQKQIEEVAHHHNPSGWLLETTGSFGQDITYWTTQAPDALILDIPEDDLLQGFFFTKLRKDIPVHLPIVILCSSISSSMMQLSLHFSKIRMLKTPIESFALYRTVMDLTQEYAEGKRQVQPRYLTNQEVEIHSDYHQGVMKAFMKNLSLSGAYFESLQPSFELKAGDLARISVVTQTTRQYVFDVKVIWSKIQDSGAHGYGVTFVDKEEVYNHLLKGL